MAEQTKGKLKVVDGEPDPLLREIGEHSDYDALDELMYTKVKKIIFTAMYDLSALGLSHSTMLRYVRSRLHRIVQEFMSGHYGVR